MLYQQLIFSVLQNIIYFAQSSCTHIYPDRNVSSSYERELNMSALRMKKIKYFFVMGTKIPKELYDFRCFSILALG